MTTFVAAPVAVVTQAARRMADFRAGYAQALEHLAHEAINRMPNEGQRLMEPMLRILGAETAQTYAEKLYVAAARADGHWDPTIDPDSEQLHLEALCRAAAHDVADEFHRDSGLCREATGG